MISCCKFTVVLLSSMNVRHVCVQWKGIGLLLKAVLTRVDQSPAKDGSVRIIHMYKNMQELVHKFSFILVKQHKLKMLKHSLKLCWYQFSVLCFQKSKVKVIQHASICYHTVEEMFSSRPDKRIICD